MKLKDRWKQENDDFAVGIKIISKAKPKVKKVVKPKVKKNG
jgi:hypothetical protein